MSNKNKRYYWIMLQEDFFEDDTIAYIEEQENGVHYINFYLKLIIKSMNTDGRLIRIIGNKVIPYDVPSLAKLTNCNIDTVAVALKLFIEIGLIEALETGELYMSNIDEMVGSETSSARRMRKKRAIDSFKENNINGIENKELNSDLIGWCHIVQKSDEHIDIDIERDIEIDINNTSVEVKEKHDLNSVIKYLNEKTNNDYRMVEGNKKPIRARYNEGYTLEDFKKVIDNKCKDWIGTDFEKFLRCSTLFGTKFDEYLNAKVTSKKPQEHKVYSQAVQPIYSDENDDLVTDREIAIFKEALKGGV